MIEPLAPPPELLALLQTRASFVLALHKGPDGDAMGAGLALYHALLAQGRQVQIVAPTPTADHYLWMPGAEVLRQEVAGTPEVVIFLDCDSASRLGDLEGSLASLARVAQIDHHKGEAFGHVQYLDRTAAATTVMVLRILTALNWPVTADIATCLYTGMVTDTGFFRFENTNEEVLRAAADMVALGVRASGVAQAVSEARPLHRMRLMGRALDSLQTAADGAIVFSVLRAEDYTASGASMGDTEGIIDLLKQVRGQQVAFVLKATNSENRWGVSMRAPVVDVAEVARQFGGGGHARAAGFDAEGTAGEVVGRLVAALEKALAELAK